MLQFAHMQKHIAILGAGNMGTALAVCAARHAPVVLWSIELDVVGTIMHKRENTKYLAGIRLSKNISATSQMQRAVAGARLVIVAVPSHVVAVVSRDMAKHLPKTALVLNVAKGVDEKSLAPMIDVIEDELPAANKKLLATLS
ncbi:MAG: NAD(P)-binding domain-containing protein, partial [bacterium]